MLPRSWVAVWVGVVALAGCQAAAVPGASCARAADCGSPLVCRFGRCRAECSEARDCPIGARCIGSAGAGVCTLDVENHCTTTICPSPLSCVADQCRTLCTTTADCLAGACEGTSCVEPIAGVDAGMGGDSAMLDGGSDAAHDDAGSIDGGQDDGGADAGPIDDAGTGPCMGAACAGGIVISEIVPGRNFFIELYASGSRDVDLSNCRLVATGGPGGATSTQVLPLGTLVVSHGYWLFAPPTRAITDLNPTVTFTVDGTMGSVSLLCGTTTLDLVGWGGTTHYEGAPLVTLPASPGSVERKAFSTSSSMTMSAGGSDAFLGNAEDTDVNANDFVLRGMEDPQASSSITEP